MPLISHNRSIQEQQEVDTVRALEKPHEAQARKKEEVLLEKFENKKYILKWYETHGSYMGGRIGKLFSKYRAGTLHKDALEEVYAQFQEGNKWDKDDYKKVIDHLAKGHFAHFGKNLPLVIRSMDDKNDDVRNLTLDFVRKKTLHNERYFLKRLMEVKKSHMTPEELALQTKGALAILEGGPDTAVKEETREVVRTTDLGLLPLPPEQEKYAEKVRALTGYLEESTKRLHEVDKIVNESQTLAESKETLRARLEKDPDFAKRTVERLIEDYDLLKRTSEVVAKTSKNNKLEQALEAFNKARRHYQYEQEPATLKEDETLHTKFLKAKESLQAKEALLKAANDSIKSGLLEAALEIEVQRALDEEIFDAADNNREVEEQKLAQQAAKIQAKYEIEKPLLDEETATKVKTASKEAVDYERANADTRKEYLAQAIKINQWQGLCIDMAEHINMVQNKAGIKLVETQDGWGIYPRQVTLAYKEEEVKTLAQRADQDELSPDAKPGGEFDTDEKGQVKFARKTAKITKIEYIPQSFDPNDPDEKAAREDYEKAEAWHPETPRKGVLKITVEREGADGKKRVDVMSHRDFLAWVGTTDAIEKIDEPKKVEEMVKEATGAEIELKAGTVLMAESALADSPTYELVEIKSIDNGMVTLNVQDPKNLPVYRSPRELPYASTIKVTQTARKLPLGAMYSWITRRNMVQIGDDVDLSQLSDKEKAFWYHYGANTEGEIRWLKKDGTLGDLLQEQGDKIFAGAALTASQLDAFRRTPRLEEHFLDPQKRHIVRRNTPGKRLMQLQNKYALKDPRTGRPAIPGASLPEDEDKVETQNLTDEEKEALKAVEEQRKRVQEDPEKGKRHYREEALPEARLGRIGEAHKSEIGYMRGLWRRSTFLASDDFWGLFKACYEHYERRWHRRSKEKFSKVGSGLPWGYGTEMNRIKQQAENEEVNQNMEAMEDWGVWEIQDTLRNAGNKDQLKACFQILAKKGHLRWDDIDMWRKLNEYIPQSLMIPLPPNENPNFIDKKTNRTGFEYLEGAIDYLWGEGMYQNWHSENNSTYQQEYKKYWEKGKQLEGDPKHTNSIVGELQILLTKHKRGEWVDPHEYEGLIHFMIDYGKGTMESKLYYMMEGVSIPSPTTGKTLLNFDRIGSINGDYLNRLPWMDYLVRRDVPRPDGTVSSWTIADFRSWCAQWDAAAEPGQENKPNQKVIKFIWENVLTDERAIIRNNKGLRNAQDMDHDDAHFIIPLADEELVTNICQNAGGQRKYFTTEGYANAYPGFNQYIKTLAEIGEKSKLLNCIRSFARFNSIMDRRYARDSDTFARLGPSFWKRPSVVDNRYTGFHKAQMEKLLFEIADAYQYLPHGARLKELTKTMHIETEAHEKEKQKDVENAIKDYGKQLEKVVKIDGGDRLVAVVNNFNLSGMPEYVTEEEKQLRSALYKEDDDLSKTFTDWGSEFN